MHKACQTVWQGGAINPKQSDKGRKWLIPAATFLACLLITLAIYWPCLSLGFRADDVEFINHCRLLGWHQDWRAWIPVPRQRAVLLWRPYGSNYMVGMYQLFGDNPLPFKLNGLIWHAFNGTLISLISYRLTKAKWSLVAGLVYVSAAIIFLDMLCWFSGFYDEGSIAFTLLSIFLLLNGKIGRSVLCYAVAILIKESALLVVPVVAAMWIFRSRRFAEIGGYFGVLAGYIGIRASRRLRTILSATTVILPSRPF
jgi:hypothetical protein